MKDEKELVGGCDIHREVLHHECPACLKYRWELIEYNISKIDSYLSPIDKKRVIQEIIEKYIGYNRNIFKERALPNPDYIFTEEEYRRKDEEFSKWKLENYKYFGPEIKEWNDLFKT